MQLSALMNAACSKTTGGESRNGETHRTNAALVMVNPTLSLDIERGQAYKKDHSVDAVPRLRKRLGEVGKVV